MKQAPLLTKEEYELVKDYLLLPIIFDVLERDIKKLDMMKLKMSEIYVRLLRGIQDKILLNMLNDRTLLKERGIKVYEQRRTELGIEAFYLCRGYPHAISMLWGFVRAEVQVRLCEYLGINYTNEVTT